VPIEEEKDERSLSLGRQIERERYKRRLDRRSTRTVDRIDTEKEEFVAGTTGANEEPKNKKLSIGSTSE